jgi:dihydrofolate reductase
MATVVVGMTISLDGFVADREGSVARLYPDLAALRGTPYMTELIEETGAVLMGRRTFEMGDPDSYVGEYEFQVPIFVMTHEPPRRTPKQDERLTFTFATEGVAAAVEQARAAAGEKVVQVVGGPNLVQQLLEHDLADELRVDVMPVLLGSGVRLFRDGRPIGLEMTTVQQIGERTSLRFRIRRGNIGTT